MAAYKVKGRLKIIDINEDGSAYYQVGPRKLRGPLPVEFRNGDQVQVTASGSSPKAVLQAQTPEYLTTQKLENIEKVVQRNVPGIGKTRAADFLEYIGGDVSVPVEKMGEAYKTVTGKTADAKVLEGLEATRKHFKDFSFFEEIGLGAGDQRKLLRHYNIQHTERGVGYENKIKKVISDIQKEPYSLMDVKGIGFKTADAIAQKMGVEKTSSERHEAFVEDCLEQARQKGHVYVPESHVLRRAYDDIGADKAEILKALENGRCYYHEGLCASPIAVAQEKSVATTIREIARVDFPSRWENCLKAAEASGKMETLSPRQRRALGTILKNRISILTGGPGTGKTHVVSILCNICREQGMDVRIVAPTGKAARVISSKSGMTATTVHSALQWNGYGAPRRSFPFREDLLVVDEASMLDLEMMHHLCTYIKESHCHVVLVGDPDQLPSVGAGAVLRDIIDSRRVPREALKEVFRQAEGSAIASQAAALAGSMNPRTEGAEVTVLEFDKDANSTAAREAVAARSRQLLVEHGDGEGVDLQVLVPGNDHPLGARSMNEFLRPLYVQDRPRHAHGFCVEDRVIHTINDQSLKRYESTCPSPRGLKPMGELLDTGVYNGEVGKVVFVDPARIIVKYDDAYVEYRGKQPKRFLQFAWTLTIHKSQGSEWDHVIIVLPRSHIQMTTRRLLYTAMTRAKKTLTIYAAEGCLGHAVRNKTETQRLTKLTDRLRGK